MKQHEADQTQGFSYDVYYAEEILRLLKDRISEIRYVSEWARLAGCSRGKLYQVIKNHYGMTPSALLAKTRYKCIVAILKENLDVTSSYVGSQVGLKDEQGMYKFLSQWYKTNFTELRGLILKKHLEL